MEVAVSKVVLNNHYVPVTLLHVYGKEYLLVVSWIYHTPKRVTPFKTLDLKHFLSEGMTMPNFSIQNICS